MNCLAKRPYLSENFWPLFSGGFVGPADATFQGFRRNAQAQLQRLHAGVPNVRVAVLGAHGARSTVKIAALLRSMIARSD
jgi:hypothetical protein